MNKGLRLHFVADEVVLYQYGVRNIDLMKKGLRLEYIASCCSPGDIVRNRDLMKKGLRRLVSVHLVLASLISLETET